jgi:DNA repair protein RecN (Recombination protein N)
MLKKISIQNYALIRELELDFGSGLNIITGETGAGKSIIIGALGLILGNRADVNVLKDKGKKCFVEAVFDMDLILLEHFFQKHDIDIEDSLIIRRQINPQGKSRAFINDIPVKLPILRELASQLIDVNSQHQTYSLNDAKTQLQLLDDYADIQDLLFKYRFDLKSYKALIRDLEQIEEQERKAKAEQDYLQFQFDELENIGLKEGEFSLLEQELEVLDHAEEIKSQLFAIGQILNSDEHAVLEKLSYAIQNIKGISSFHNDYKSLNERLLSAQLELQDIADTVETIGDNIEFDPQRLDEIQSRVDMLNHLMQKHMLTDADRLIELKYSLEEQLLGFSRLGEDKESLKKQIGDLFDKLSVHSDKLHEKRQQVVSEIEEKVKKSLGDLGMSGASFKIELNESESFGDFGKDAVQFLFSANKGVEVGPISKIASGGELSRLMLTLKYILTSRKSLSSIIFDEIDTGVSGDIAGMVGDMMKKMGNKMQIIAITHLPQIAAKAQQHYKVYKQEGSGQTYSLIKQLNDEERVEELSMMISGKKKSDAALTTARELME